MSREHLTPINQSSIIDNSVGQQVEQDLRDIIIVRHVDFFYFSVGDSKEGNINCFMLQITNINGGSTFGYTEDKNKKYLHKVSAIKAKEFTNRSLNSHNYSLEPSTRR